MGRLLFKALVGGIAALVGWMLIEPSNPGMKSIDNWQSFEMRMLLLVGVLLGCALGALDGYFQGSRLHTLRGAGLGLVFGVIGMMLGHSVGSAMAQAISGGVYDGLGPGAILSRTLAIAPMGLFLGLGIGASTLVPKRIWQSGIGGLIGGAAGGFLFNVVGSIVGPLAVAVQNPTPGAAVEVGQLPRALTLTLIGLCIGLFIGLVELVSRSAWVRLVLGRNEGKEWPIDSAQTFLGRSERAQIPLFGDPNIAPMHACIAKQGNAYTISDGGSQVGTYVNGQRIQQAPLFHGAQIQVGSYALQFLMKHGAVPARGPENFNQAYAIQDPMVGYPHPGQAAQPSGAAPYGGQPVAYPTQAMPQQGSAPFGYPAPAAQHPVPGSLYGSQPTQVIPSPSGAFAAQQPTIAYPVPGAQHPAPGFTLAVLDGPLIGQRFPVRNMIELGRESSSIPMGFDTGASRRHASVAPGPMGLMVSDLNSTNGTFVNGQRVQSANAGPGDLIKIGATTFRVEPG
ncbi:MAG: FHA domain-containing protein [Fimbriimonadales bacterium]